jgi:tRNA G18 (ribose-2'-O)-methylase SpoU
MLLFLLLDQLSDVRNFGTIIRTIECTDVNSIIIQKSGSTPVNAKNIKTSAAPSAIEGNNQTAKLWWDVN